MYALVDCNNYYPALREKLRLFRAEMDSADAKGILALDGCK